MLFSENPHLSNTKLKGYLLSTCSHTNRTRSCNFLCNGHDYIVFGSLKAMGLTSGILVLLLGIWMFLGELVPAFKGICDELVQCAILALDVSALLGYDLIL